MTTRTGALRRLLVPLDGSRFSEQAIPFAQLLGGTGCELTLIHVVPDAEPIYGLLGDVIASEAEVRDITTESARNDLVEAVERMGLDATSTRLEVAVGDPAEQIIASADRFDSDAIVIASHGRGALGRWTFGSVADRLARGADVPVLLMRPTEPGTDEPFKLQRVIVPLDGSDIAEEALTEAAHLAIDRDVPLVLMRAINVATAIPTLPGIDVAYPAESYVDAERRLVTEASDYLNGVQERVNGLGVAKVEILIQTGPAISAIVTALHQGDLVVMTSHGRSGIRRWLIGSVAEKLVRTAPTPVLLVPSAGREKMATA